MPQLTPEEFQEIEKFIQAAPTLFTGLVMDETPAGRSNATLIAGFLDGRSQKYTVATLTNAVIELQFVLSWTAGNAPIVAPSDNRTRAQKAVDGGINPYEGTQYTDRANGIESSWAKNIRLEKAAVAQKAAALAKENLRSKETSQVVQNKINGGVDWAATNELREQARRRHAAEDAAESGKPVRVQTGFRVIPDNETNFKGPAENPYTSAELSAYLARRKGRAGEPHGSLLR